MRDEVFGIRAYLGRSHDVLVDGRGERDLGSAVANEVRELFDVRPKFAWVWRVPFGLSEFQGSRDTVPRVQGTVVKVHVPFFKARLRRGLHRHHVHLGEEAKPDREMR